MVTYCTFLPNSVFNDVILEIGHGGSSYTIEIGEHYKSGLFFSGELLLNIYQYATGLVHSLSNFFLCLCLYLHPSTMK